MKRNKRLLSIAISLCMVFSLFVIAPTVSYADSIDPPIITTFQLPYGAVGTPYNKTLNAKSTATVTWAIAGGNLPDGLSLSPDGVISGTPTTDGSFNFDAEADNGADTSASKFLNIKIYPATQPSDIDALVSSINDTYVSGGTGTLTATKEGNIVTVTGSVTGATSQLAIDIPFGVTLKWQASLSGVFGNSPLIENIGPGTFEIQSGSLLSLNGNNVKALLSSGNIIMSGGSVSVIGNSSVGINSEKDVFVSGGTITATAANPNSDYADCIYGNTINISETPQLKSIGHECFTIWGYENIEISGNPQITVEGDISTLMRTNGNADISISGGTFNASGEYSMILNLFGVTTADISGGTFNATGTGSSVLYFQNDAVADISGGTFNATGAGGSIFYLEDDSVADISGGSFNVSGGAVLSDVTNSNNPDTAIVIGDNVIIPADVDARLSAIAGQTISSIGTGTITAPKTATINVPYSKDSIASTDITAVSATATIQIFSSDDFVTGEGAPIALAAGIPAHVYVKVTAADTTTTGYYDVTVIRGVAVSSISITGADTITVKGGTLQLAATVLPENAADKTVTWSIVSGGEAATLGVAGLLTAKADGTVKVRATANDGFGIYGEKAVTISGQTSNEQTTDTEAISITGAKATKITDKAYSGKQIKPAVVVTLGGAKLSAQTDYSVTYKDNKNIGKATVTITGKGKYKDTVTATFRIVPKKFSISKLVVGKKQIKVTWKAASKAQKITKYQLRYKVKGAKKWSKVITVSAKSKSYTIKKLTKGKAYQVQVRTYKTVSKAKYYSAWSGAKTSGKLK